MLHKNQFHLTYCTNIHPGESWEEVKESLQRYLPSVKQKVSPDKAFGVGLRLSALAARQLLQDRAELMNFKQWLLTNDCYVFTMNGFPYGSFHGQAVKDQVHSPDWTNLERVEYTRNLIEILAELLPLGIDGGISTSPLSYKYWWKTEVERQKVMQKATENLLSLLPQLDDLSLKKNRYIHLDLEPEPDGLIENSEEVLHWVKTCLEAKGPTYLRNGFPDLYGQKEDQNLITLIKKHLCLCYDVCHFAVAFENHADAIAKFSQKGIRIGKFQISAALRADFTGQVENDEALISLLQRFNESTYLHQVIAKMQNGELIQFRDLPEAFAKGLAEARQWRIHFHVPVFLARYKELQSTQEDILEIMKLLKDQPLSNHLEIETYTWEVLPEALRLDLSDSIVRELEWFRQKL